MPLVNKVWPVGEPNRVSIARTEAGLGLKLTERNGAVYVEPLSLLVMTVHHCF